jgi:heterotetrameric sarcosine oxidase gamma subunit
MPPHTLPSHARVVVIGGGIIGCSVAYHLSKGGWKDVVLLERDKITSGTTWHAAGLMVTFGSTSETSTEIRKYSKKLYRELEAETGQATGFKPVGFIEVAADTDRLEEYRRIASFNRLCGIDVEEISPTEIAHLFPYAKVDDLLAGFYVRDDGRVNPVDVTMALAKGARLYGAQIFEGVPVTTVLQRHGAVTGVVTPSGTVTADYVVNCTGMWARQLGEELGVTIPNQAAEHYYLITDDIPGIPRDLPVLEDPAAYGYYREEVGGLMIGLFEPVAAPWKIEGIPNDFSFGDLPPDWERMTPFLERAMSRVPASLDVGIRKFFCGPESFTPDLRPIVGEAPELRNYFVAAGMNSIGILSAGGLGRVLAHWIMHGTADVDVTGFHIDRFHRYQSNRAYRRERTIESLGLVYKCHYPTRVAETARDAKRSPFHARLTEAGAYFRDVSGWESPDWYAPPGITPQVERLSWGRQNWFPYWASEHHAARESVIIMDMSFMSKFLVQGNDAGRLLDYISANKVNGACGTITYTQWLNQDGKIEADLTVTKLAEDRFLVVVTDTMHRHAETWLRRHIPSDAHAFVTDVTSGFGQLNLQGPRARELLQELTSVDLADTAFPFRAAQEIDIGFARVLCIRITYLGERGFELYIPAEQSVHVYDAIVRVGVRYGLRHAGLKALSSLRLEKGYRDYGHDIDNTDNPFEAGLGFAVDLKRPDDFIGRAAAERIKARAPYHRRLAQIFVCDPAPLLFHAEVIFRNGQPVGYVRAGSYGHTLGGAVGLFMIEAGEPIDTPYIETASWEVEIAGKRYPARVSLKPLYDPEMRKIKG